MLEPFCSSTSKEIIPALIRFFWGSVWLFGVGALAGIYVLKWWPGDKLLVVRLLNYAMPWLLIILLPTLILAGITQRKWLLLTLALPTVYIVLAHMPLFLPKNQSPDNIDGQVLKVMSYNIWSRNVDLTGVVEVIKSVSPDVLLLQEVEPKNFDRIAALLTDLFPDTKNDFQYMPKAQLATFSRYRLSSEENDPLGSVQKLRLHTPVGPVTIFNVHFLRTVFRRKDHWQRQHNKITRLVAEDVAKTKEPLILGGDFNMTDQTETYRQICLYMKNAHSQVGRGFGFTFPSGSRKFKGVFALPPMVRIDHIFYNNALIATEAATLPAVGGSDHLPIIAWFTIPVQ